MGGMEDYKVAIVMVGLQVLSAGVTLFTRATLVNGLSPRVLVVYRQGIAALVMAPIALISRRKSSGSSPLGLRGFAWLFAASLFGVTANQMAYFEGLYLSSSSVASAMTNIMPAITFVMAFIAGWEKVNIRSMRSIAKILGTVFCVSGAVSMALFKGPKLLNAEFIPVKSLLFNPGVDNWLLGCFLLFVGAWFWSLWLILLVPISKYCPDHAYSSAWMCFFASLQAAIVALVEEKTADAWTLHSFSELACCLYTGIVLAVSFFVQAWCISKRGPLFCSMFNPLCTVIVTIFASIFLNEEIYTGSLVGGFAVIAGLYIVLWGKAKDIEGKRQETKPKLQDEQTSTVQVIIEEPAEKKSCETDLEEPLLSGTK
ncbi:WAT1-related protein [Melia azedarach]|uniref:WAT1-related protein n=1 Tax=Melia azedarach TaxID=155640 RepID=A0ACC1XDY8_MELAZ|nr:WAT1-related protein [Melia azedarach]